MQWISVSNVFLWILIVFLRILNKNRWNRFRKKMYFWSTSGRKLRKIIKICKDPEFVPEISAFIHPVSGRIRVQVRQLSGWKDWAVRHSSRAGVGRADFNRTKNLSVWIKAYQTDLLENTNLINPISIYNAESSGNLFEPIACRNFNENVQDFRNFSYLLLLLLQFQINLNPSCIKCHFDLDSN